MVGQPVRDVAARVQLEQFLRHLANGGARAVALLRPLLAAQPVETRRGRVVGEIRGVTEALHLINAIERDVEPVAPFVLDDDHLDGAFPDEDRLHAAVNADAVLEVHYEVTGLERADELERGSRGVAPRATDAPVAPEDLVVGENA